MAKFEHWSHIEQYRMRFFYSLTTISFAILGLSIQFSPSYGKTYPHLLIAAWILLLISAIVGGWRLLMIPEIQRLDIDKQERETYLKNVEKVEAYPGPVLGKLPTKEQKDSINFDIEKVKKYTKKHEKNIAWTYCVQIYGFLFGVITNLIFVSINYLEKSIK